jgi:hypothetical protein
MQRRINESNDLDGDCRECGAPAIYPLREPDENGCNWSVGAYRGPPACQGVIARIVAEVQSLFNLRSSRNVSHRAGASAVAHAALRRHPNEEHDHNSHYHYRRYAHTSGTVADGVNGGVREPAAWDADCRPALAATHCDACASRSERRGHATLANVEPHSGQNLDPTLKAEGHAKSPLARNSFRRFCANVSALDRFARARPGSRFPHMVICPNCFVSTSFIRGGERIAATVWNVARR